jgi:maspardin
VGGTLETAAGLRDFRARCAARTVAVAGKSWRVRDTGGFGTALILLPGSLGNADIFYRQVLGLAPRFRCIAVDYPDAPANVLADGLAGLLDGLDLGRACLLGSSLAGHWLQVFGTRHPARVAAMVLANTFYDSNELRQHPLFSIPVLKSTPGETLKAEWLARLEARAPDELRNVQIELLRDGQDGESLRLRLLAAASASPAPVMPAGRFTVAVLDCADDPILTAPTRDAVAARYPTARRLTLSTGGHYPYVTQAKEYNQFVESVVTGC